MNERIVEISCRSVDGPRYGSGFVLAPRLVLTARHVVAGADTVRVRSLRDDAVRTCRPVWESSVTDAALLEVVGEGWRPGPVRLGWFASSAEISCRCIGFPRFQADPAVGNDTEQVLATIAPGTGAVSGRWQLRIEGDAPSPAWEGMSGSAVVAGPGVLVGVVTEALSAFTPQRLRAEPVWRIAAEPGFADAWRRVAGGDPPVLEAADLDPVLATRATPPAVLSPGSLLRAEVAAVRFAGRDRELAELRSWAEGDGLAVHLVTGPAGAGKSRLALQLAADLRAGGWVAGQLAAGEGVRRLAALTRPVLCVVDYAEGRIDEVSALLTAVRHDLHGAPLRVLLLARTDREWYERLVGQFDLLTRTPIRLGPLPAAPAVVFADAVHDLAAAIHRLPAEWPIGDPARLAPPSRVANSPLEVQAAALAALLQDGDAAVPLPSGVDVWDVLLRHEEAYWNRTATPWGVSQLRSELVAATVLCDPADRSEAREVVARVLRSGDPLEPGTRLAVEWLRDLYPSWVTTSGFWDGMRPDRLAEHFVTRVVADEPGLPARLLAGAPAHQTASALTVLTRAAAHRPEAARMLVDLLARRPELAVPAIEVATRSEDPAALIAALTSMLSGDDAPVDLLWQLSDAVPTITPTLAEVALLVTTRLVEFHLPLVDDPEHVHDVLAAFERHAHRLTEVGRTQEAFEVNQAVFDLATNSLDHSADSLASLLIASSNLANGYAAVGRHQEAVKLAQSTAAVVASEDRLELASWQVMTFTALVTLLLETGQTGAAVDMSAQAAAAARRLVDAGDENGSSLLNMTLSAAAGAFANAGRPYDAAAAAAEALAVARSTVSGPGPHANVGWDLLNLAGHLDTLGQRAEQLAAIEEAVDTFRPLAADDRDRYLASLSDALAKLQRTLAAVGRRDEALRAAEENAEAVRTLVRMAPDRFRDRLATALDDYAGRLLDVDEFDRARQVAADADRIREGGEIDATHREEAVAMPQSPLDAIVDQLADQVAANPTDTALRLLLVQALITAGRAAEALEHANAALAADPSSPAARDAVAAALAGVGRSPTPATAERVPNEGESGSVEPVVETERPNVRLQDVAGMQTVKDRLEMAFLGPLRNPEIVARFGQTVRGGLLLYGPPGCGKTFIAKAIAGELGVSFISVSLADTLDMWIGSSEKNIQAIFRAARAHKPCVLFLDEADAIGGKRSHNRLSGMRNVVTQLLTELDSVESDNERVFVLAASNHPWDIDDALLRPGRFDRTLFVAPPDEVARAAIIRAQLTRVPAAGVDMAQLAAATENYSGADVVHLCRSAIEYAMHDSMRVNQVRDLGMGDFRRALAEVRPSVGPWFDAAKNVVAFARDDHRYAELTEYLGKRKRR
jgi:AAA+ superfamily predicted ATPase/tetratricopeptide (TPR) repeat protein